MIFLNIIILFMPATSFAGNCADVDNSGAINILDITYLINYVYKEGPIPNCSPMGILIDIDGNEYQTIKIGDQWWMMENLKVTHYRNGDPIPNVTDSGEWVALTTGAYCEYDNALSNTAVYGRLYNWYAVDDGRNIAPEGWHVPTDNEWKLLEMYLGMSQAEADQVDGRGTDEGGKLKESGTYHWLSPNTGATNESGFTALPGGHRDLNGMYNDMHLYAPFWSFTAWSGDEAWFRALLYLTPWIHRNYYNKKAGLSIRCVRD
jgi:uncharacterized protein (TIGR02145 family)